jgi:glycosyltransferase involved in cell wall biosynthesis
VNSHVMAIVPALNEASTIAQVVTGLRTRVARVIVVDDGSSDATADSARAAGATVISHTERRGKGQAVRTALGYVLAQPHVDLVLILDGDMQHLPEEAGRLIDTARATGADLVVGQRQFDRNAIPATRFYANRYGSAALSSFTGVPLQDTQCGYRIFRADMLRRLRLRATGYDIETEMLVKVSRVGGRIVSVPVSAVYGAGRSKLRPVRDTTRTCFRAVYYRYIEQL